MHRFLLVFKKYKKVFIVPLVVVTAYVVSVVFLYYSDTNTFKGDTNYSGISVENLTAAQAADVISQNIASTKVTITADDITLQTNAESLGAAVDTSVLAHDIKKQKLRYALFPFLYVKTYTLPIISDQDKLVTTARNIELPADKRAPIDAQVDYVNNAVVILPETAGDGIDTSLLFTELKKQLQDGKNEVQIITNLTTVSPRVTAEELNKRMNDITYVINKKYAFTNGTKEVVVTPEQVARSLYIDENKQLIPTYPAAAAIVSAAINEFTILPISELRYKYTSGKLSTVFQKGTEGTIVTNEPELINQLQTAVLNGESKTIQLATTTSDYQTKEFIIDDANKKVYTYSIDSWGTTSSVAYFREKAAETLLSEKGWSQAGITFVEVATNPDFNLVLSEGVEMSRRYSPVCDAYYSCRVGSKVIINDARWINATPVWPKDIYSYQNLVINHETGHWLGLGHYYCTGPGAPAPVMQQQSIDIRNCTFNEWPLSYEIQKLM